MSLIYVNLWIDWILQEVFKPTLQYLKAEQFDAARTNTNYITRFFNLKKKIDALIVQANDVVDDTDKVRTIPPPCDTYIQGSPS